MHDPTSRPTAQSQPRRWLASCVLLAVVQFSTAEDPAPVTPAPTPAPIAEATTAPSPQTDIDRLVTDALVGDAGALAMLRTAGLGVDDSKAMAILERVRTSGASRNSAIAAVFVHHPEAWVQRTAISTIAKVGIDGRETLDLLVKTIEHPSPLVAQAAAAALGDLRDARSWPRLIEMLAATDANHVRLAHGSLQRQTNQTWPAEQTVWTEWFDKRMTEEQAQFANFQLMLADAALNSPVIAVDGLASLDLLRDQATAILITLVDHPDATVRAHVERHLRQWTGTLGGEPLTVALDRAQTRAVTPPPPALVAPTTKPAAALATAALPTSEPGFFSSTYGMVLIVTLCSAALAILLWFLRTPAGQLVQGATNRSLKQVARSRVVVTMSDSTRHSAKTGKPAAKPANES